MTPLHFAAQNGHLSVVEYLVNQKADLNAKNNKGYTPLSLANERRKMEVAEFLIGKGAQ